MSDEGLRAALVAIKAKLQARSDEGEAHLFLNIPYWELEELLADYPPHLTDDGATDTPPPVAAGAESATSTAAPSSPHRYRLAWLSARRRATLAAFGYASEGATPAIDREAPTRSQIAEALHEEGAYCGDCDFEDDWTLCVGCRGVLGDYADAVLKLLDGAR